MRAERDRELTEAIRRSRLHLARDINDQRTLAAAGEPPIRRGNHWTWLAVAVVVTTVLALTAGRGEDVVLAADCAHPAVALAASEVTAGEALRYRLTGADDTPYVVTLDGQPVQGDAGSTVSYTSTAAGPALELQQCLSPTLLLAAPAGNGPHVLALLEVADDGSTRQVATATVTVIGGR